MSAQPTQLATNPVDFLGSELLHELLRLGIGTLKIVRDAPAYDLLGPAILHNVVVVRMARDFVGHDLGRIETLTDLYARKS